MAITNGYLTLSELKGWLDISDTNDDAQLELAIEAASRAIDEFCGRRFWQASETRYYTACGDVVRVDDLVSISTLKTDAAGDGTFETTWASGDYTLEPFNAAVEGRPYLKVSRSRVGSYAFPRAARGVEIVGTFGWPSVPTEVKQACVMQAHRFFRVGREAAMGIAHLAGVDGVGGMRLTSRLSPDVQVLLADLRRNVVQVG